MWCLDDDDDVQMPDAYASVGAMTHSFIRALECEPRGVTYGRLLTSMRAIMKNRGGGHDLQGPIGAPIHTVANFSGVQVRDEILIDIVADSLSVCVCRLATN